MRILTGRECSLLFLSRWPDGSNVNVKKKICACNLIYWNWSDGSDVNVKKIFVLVTWFTEVERFNTWKYNLWVFIREVHHESCRILALCHYVSFLFFCCYLFQNTLDKTGALENTYIMYTSDHGYNLGQFRLSSGKFHIYEHDIRWVRWADRPWWLNQMVAEDNFNEESVSWKKFSE